MNRTTPPTFVARIAAALLAPLAGLQAAETPRPAAKPNVVLILIDDFGYECVTADGGESYKTPVMDNLAKAACASSNATCSRSARPRAWS